MAALEHTQTVCRYLCSSVREASDFEDLECRAAKHGLKVEQAWRAPRGEGFKAATARFMVNSEDVLVVAFRSTFGSDEWLEYPQKYWKRKFLPHSGEKPGTDLKVFGLWGETLDEIWFSPGEEVAKTRDTLRGLIWRQLNAGNRVWLAGHSKGGAVATTAASRLLLGDAVVDAELPDPATRRPEGRMVTVRGGPLSRLSVYTFNAPMAFTVALAELYDARMLEVGGKHVRFEQKADRVRKLPPLAEMVHVGERQLQGQGVVEDTAVLFGGTVAVVGMVATLVAAVVKIANSH